MSEKNSNLRLPTCYYCDLPFDHDFDSVVNENTQRLFVGYQPCEKCKKQIDKGFLIMGVVEHETFPQQPPISKANGKDLYPTQNIIVLSNEAKEILRQNDPNLSHIDENTPGAYMPDKYVKELINEFTDQLIANNDHSDHSEKGESDD